LVSEFSTARTSARLRAVPMRTRSQRSRRAESAMQRALSPTVTSIRVSLGSPVSRVGR
jgi:hypothetical protein